MDVKKELLLSYKKIALQKSIPIYLGENQGQRAEKSPKNRGMGDCEVGFSMTESKALLNMLRN